MYDVHFKAFPLSPITLEMIFATSLDKMFENVLCDKLDQMKSFSNV